MPQELLTMWTEATKQNDRQEYGVTAMFFEHWTNKEPATINQKKAGPKANCNSSYPPWEIHPMLWSIWV